MKYANESVNRRGYEEFNENHDLFNQIEMLICFLLTIDIRLPPGLPIMNQMQIHIYQFLIKCTDIRLIKPEGNLHISQWRLRIEGK